MSSNKELMAADLRGPFNRLSFRGSTGCECIVINVADTATHNYDLSSSTYFNNTLYQSRFVRIISETAGDIWYIWSSSASDTVDKTATSNTAGTVSAYLVSKTPSDELSAGRYLVMQAASAGLVRIWITNRTV